MDDNDDATLLGHFQKNYNKVLEELDILHRGVYDADEGIQTAALALLTQAPLIKIQAAAEHRSRSLKRDIDFKKAEVYAQIKAQSSEKKITEATLTHLINKDPDVHRLYQEQNVAEKESKELSNILAMLKDAHITFRSLAKKGD